MNCLSLVYFFLTIGPQVPSNEPWSLEQRSDLLKSLLSYPNSKPFNPLLEHIFSNKELILDIVWHRCVGGSHLAALGNGIMLVIYCFDFFVFAHRISRKLGFCFRFPFSVWHRCRPLNISEFPCFKTLSFEESLGYVCLHSRHLYSNQGDIEYSINLSVTYSNAFEYLCGLWFGHFMWKLLKLVK